MSLSILVLPERPDSNAEHIHGKVCDAGASIFNDKLFLSGKETNPYGHPSTGEQGGLDSW
jgi:hypothetical protein